MRPIAVDQDVLRNPLNQVLATEAEVRLLRELCLAKSPLSIADAATRAELSHSGARKALLRLAASGLVERHGAGRNRRFAIRWEDSLASALVELFTAERRRYDDLLGSLRRVFEECSDPPLSAWVREFPHRLSEPLEIEFLRGARGFQEVSRELRQRISEIERRFAMTIELIGYTRADLPEARIKEYVLLAGVPLAVSLAECGTTGRFTHADHDRQSLDVSGRVAELIDQDPSIVERALQHIDKLLGEEQGPAAHDLREWQQILKDYSLDRLIRFLISDSVRAVRLRQSSPFPAVLTKDERRSALPSSDLTP